MAAGPNPLPANRLRVLRIEHGLDLTSLAAELGKSVSTYTRYETGATRVPDDVKLHLAGKYGVTPGYLMGWDDGGNGFSATLQGKAA